MYGVTKNRIKGCWHGITFEIPDGAFVEIVESKSGEHWIGWEDDIVPVMEDYIDVFV